MRKMYFFPILLIFLCQKIQAQVIPDSLRINWSKAGYTGTIPQPTLIKNVKDFGAKADGVHDDYTAINNAINSTTQMHVVYFPAGTYLISSKLLLNGNTILRGDGIASVLKFSSGEGSGIAATTTQKSSFVSVTSGYKKGSTVIKVSNISGFAVNGFAEMRETNGAWNAHAKGDTGYDVGQIIKITAINGTALTIDAPLHITYDATLKPQVRPVTVKQNIGVECLKILRLANSTTSNKYSSIYFSYVSNCWVTGVESEECQRSHVYMGNSSHITVSGSYFHDAFDYGGDGCGYGVEVCNYTSDCRIENNILHTLRHAMIAHEGANGNVFGYNYSFDTKSTTEVPRDKIGDLSLHGYYAYSNLFEGNIVQNIFVDDYWGASGPYNTFFRNRSELYGIQIQHDYKYPLTSKQNIIGNEVTNKGSFILNGTNHFNYGNNIKGSINPAGTTTLNDKSYYLSKQPAFWNIIDAWPSIGISNTLDVGTNPAKERYESGGSKTICTQSQNILIASIERSRNLNMNNGLTSTELCIIISEQ